MNFCLRQFRFYLRYPILTLNKNNFDTFITGEFQLLKHTN